MGVESANYWYVAGEEVAIEAILRELGAEQPVDQRVVEYVLRDEDHWIDVQIQDRLPASPPSAWIRIALTNPLSVESRLRGLAETLLHQGGGTVVDMDSRRRLSGVTGGKVNDAEWSELWSAYLGKRSVFRQYYGTLEAAISGAAVFATLRDQKR
ncbi:hypothetical protein [Amycolatopsis sp. 195334CR]|uniref:hypothetical protein n=1 Tax=Amycolatopsis sp. 195334CR TaxID=2814588 RepID=UPI001A8D380A|nr:hypothetical protein [Amycolatopsis sp. 195334CR]MBN6039066.1 hypothetical protein [Amycolatopsis sp. 195334CR]